jgi:PEGA domain/PDZ domain
MRRAVIILTTVLLLTAPAPAPAGAAPPESLQQAVLEGRTHLTEFRFEDALASFAQVVAAYREGGLDSSDPAVKSLLGSALEGVAEAHLGIGDMDAAREAFRVALDMDPGFEPDRERQSPRLLELFDAARAGLRSVTFLTSPPGVTILVDGRERVVTRGPAPRSLARQYGMSPDLLSQEAVVEHLSPGTHAVQFRRPCYHTREIELKVELDASDPTAQALAPIVMERASAALVVRSTPSGARVSIDGAEVGSTPLLLEDLCAGEHQVEVHGATGGQWMNRVALGPGERQELMAILRPTLAYLGLTRGPDTSPELLVRVGRELEKALDALRGTYRIQVREDVDAGVLLPDHAGTPPRPDLDTVQSVARAAGAELVLLGQVRAEKLRPVVDLLLYSALQPQPDVLSAPAGDPRVDEFLRRLSVEPALQRPWLGLQALDSRRVANPVVVSLFPGGPAEVTEIRIGDRIVTMDGTNVATVADLERALSAADGESVSMDLVSAAGEERSVTVTVEESPWLIGPGSPDVLYNKRLVDLGYTAAAHPSLRSHARLNQALAFLHFQRCDLALKGPLAVLDLPSGTGISRGTVDHLRGFCLERLGPEYHQEARIAFERAAASEGATLESALGPGVAPLAKQHLKKLP